MMQVDGDDCAPDGTFELFAGERPIVHVRGILVPFLGSDGEPLLVACEQIDASERILAEVAA
jgi:hypothetical protein